MIKKILLLLLFCFFSLANPAFSQDILSTNRIRSISPYNTGNINPNEYPVVSGLERNVFGSSFEYNNIYKRLSRLENAVLGSVFPRDSLYNRVERLRRSSLNGDYAINSQNYMNRTPLNFPWNSIGNSYYNNGYNDNYYYQGNQNQSKLQKILNYAMPFINSFGGSDYGYSGSYYSPEFIQEYNSIRNTGFGAGVRILPY